MAAKPLTSEAIALTEKKMDMTLDDIIKMSKTNDSKPKKQRISNKNQKFVNDAAQDKSAKVRKFMDTRSSLRQEALSQRRSSFQGSLFPLTTEAARRAAAVPISTRALNRRKAFKVNLPRVIPSSVQNSTNGVGFMMKKQVQPLNFKPKKRTQTLDSLFANMKEQRRKMFLNPNNGLRRNGGGQPAVPWGRGRIHY